MPTEQIQRDQRSDARKRIDAYVDGLRVTGGYFRHRMMDDLRAVLADADRDRQFAEAVREVLDDHEFVRFKEAALDDIDEAHHNIYGTPCRDLAKKTKETK